MTPLMLRLWRDDRGAIIAMEFLLIATILIIGLIVGLASVRDSLNTELGEIGNSLLALSQGFIISGVSGCCSATDGSQAIDTPSLLPDIICVPPAIPSVIDQSPCN